MKPLLLCILSVIMPVTAFAQDATRTAPSPQPSRATRTVRPPQPPPASTARVQQSVRRVSPQKSAVIEVPAENVTLRWEGSLVGISELDLELTGCGPEFVADLAIPSKEKSDMPPIIVTVSAIVTKSGDGYRINHSVGARVPLKTSHQSVAPGRVVSPNIEFRDLMVRGEVIVTPGTPVALSKVNGKVLTLTLSKPE